MIEISGTLKALSSLHLGTGKKSGTFAKTLDYVPGRTIRGMIGYHLYTNHRELFDGLRIDEDKDMSNTGVFFKDALPLYADENKEYKRTVASAVALKWCKKCSHLIEDEKEGCSNIIDGKPCLQEGKKVSGFITHDSMSSRHLEQASVTTSIATKCPITRNGLTSPGSDFDISPYHVEGIIPGTSFGFKCIVEDEFADDLKTALTEAGVFSGLGGYRSRGYGTVGFSELKETPVSEIIEKRGADIADMKDVMMVTNSQMILKKDTGSVIGFDRIFEDYSSKTCAISNNSGACQLVDSENGTKQKLTRGFARGWSIKNGNRVSEIIPCIGSGSCVMVQNDPSILASLEVYGVGEMTNSGYGDVYFQEGTI